MTAAALPMPKAAVVSPSAPGRAVGRLALRQIRRGALIVAVVCGGMSAIVAVQYRSMFQGGLAASGLQALAENPAIRILFGTPVALDDVGGFTVWRTGLPVLVLASVWILLAATRITRGEEDAGRLDLLLAGRLHMVDVIARCLVAVAASAVVISTAVGAGLVAAGTNTTGAVIYAAAILGVTLTFATAGLLAAQIMPTRSAAVGVTVGFLFVCLCLRMLADGAAGTGLAGLDDPVRTHRARRAVCRQPRRPAARARRLSDRVRDGRVVDGAPSRCGRRPGRGGDEPSTPHPVAGVRHRFRDTARGSADDGVGSGDRRLLPADRRADRIGPGVF